ncbi:hypothetical protein B6V74_09610 [Thioclava sp. F42-5]|uniref:restriction endonuclease subunit S n=1 Tax=Thioclava sp. F42-5 TaxID=1973005 RepID=UPI000B53AFA5|nr:restriction endonuclease subunit S [Thioclava sp. F42-5]OWY08914.1 hypothetical protein B6V74_09610 [Thioclava sp. F42-5]
MNAQRLLDVYEQISEAPDAIARLRRFVLDLAVRGKLVKQELSDEPASDLLKRIAEHKERLTNAGEIRKSKKPRPLSDDDRCISIPFSWDWAQLGQLVTKLTDGSHNPPQNAGEGFPMLSSKNVSDGRIDFDNPTRFVSSDQFDEEDRRTKARPGDVLLTIVGTIGRSAVVPAGAPKFALQRSVAVMAPAIDAGYLAVFLRSPLAHDYFAEHGKGTAQKGIYLAKLGNLPFPLPPLAEQHRILAKVDELMALCDRLEEARKTREKVRDKLTAASLARLTAPDTTSEDFPTHAAFALEALPALTTRPDQIKTLRQTILNLAVRGKLVEQDPADEPASELLAAIAVEQKELAKAGKIKRPKPLPAVDTTLAPFDLPLGWSWARFPELGTFGRGKSKHRPRNDPALYRDGKVPFIQTGDVARSGGRITSNTGFYNEVGLAQSMLWPRGTMCITIAANIADSGILDFDACFPDSVVGLVPASMFDSARYFEYFIRTAKANLLEFAPATAQKNINLGILETVLIPLPPLTEQHRIVAKVDALMALCDRLETALAEADTTRTRLLEALLHEALEPATQTLEAAQ